MDYTQKLRSYAVQELRPFIKDQDIRNAATAHGITLTATIAALRSDKGDSLQLALAKYFRELVVSRNN